MVGTIVRTYSTRRLDSMCSMPTYIQQGEKQFDNLIMIFIYFFVEMIADRNDSNLFPLGEE